MRWRQRGRPSAAEFIAYCASYGEDRFDLRPLPPRLRLEIGYALQCRVDANRTRTTPRSIKPLLDHLSANGAESLLERPLDDWLAGLPAAAARPPRRARSSATPSSACSTCATEPAGTANTSVTCGCCGGSALPAMTVPGWISLRCNHVWLRELAKRWCRWRMSCGVGLGQLRKDRIALVRLSRLTPGLASSPGPSALDRAALEAYLARLAVELPHPKTRSTDIGCRDRVSACRSPAPLGVAARRGAAVSQRPAPPRRDTGTAGDSRVRHGPARKPRPTSTGSADPRIRLLVEVLIRTGLRIGDATRLALDCLVRDPQGAVYLRYRNHKMRRDAVVPIDDELTAMIQTQQERTRQRFPDHRRAAAAQQRQPRRTAAHSHRDVPPPARAVAPNMRCHR